MQFKLLTLSTIVSTALAQGQSLTQALAGNSNLTALTALLGQYPELTATLGGLTNITLLAPSNNALTAFLNSTAGASAATNPAAIQALLSYHVLNGSFPSTAITNRSTFVRTLLTDPNYANVTGGQRLEAISLNNQVTFFSGNFDNSTVSTANVNFTGGTIHVINRLLTIPPRLNNSLINADLRALYGAANTSGVLAAAGGLRDVTVFAPNNQAFLNIASGLGNLTAQQASDILRYHVVQSTAPYYSPRLNQTLSLQTLQGNNLTVTTHNNSVFVNGARVITPNFLIAGGVVHIIDNVLNPANITTANPTATAGVPAFSGASSSGTAVPFASGVTASRSTTPGVPAAGAATANAQTSSTTRASAAAAAPAMTGAVGKAVLFGAGAAGIWAAAI